MPDSDKTLSFVDIANQDQWNRLIEQWVKEDEILQSYNLQIGIRWNQLIGRFNSSRWE